MSTGVVESYLLPWGLRGTRSETVDDVGVIEDMTRVVTRSRHLTLELTRTFRGPPEGVVSDDRGRIPRPKSSSPHLGH